MAIGEPTYALAELFLRGARPALLAAAASAIPEHVPAKHLVVRGRIKTQASVDAKRRLNGREWVGDFVGLRVVCPARALIPSVASVASEWALNQGLEVVKRESRLEGPSPYRAVHLDFRFGDETPQFSVLGVEIQVTSWLYETVSEWSHSYGYKAVPQLPARHEGDIQGLITAVDLAESHLDRLVAAPDLP